MSRSTGKGVPMRQVARTFAMGDSARQEIILALARTDELNVSQLARKLPLSRPAISHHLKVLRQAGLARWPHSAVVMVNRFKRITGAQVSAWQHSSSTAR